MFLKYINYADIFEAKHKEFLAKEVQAEALSSSGVISRGGTI